MTGKVGARFTFTVLIVLALLVQTVQATEIIEMRQGERRSDFSLTMRNPLSGELPPEYSEYGLLMILGEARASGSAAQWVHPTTVGFGDILQGQSKTLFYVYTITIPMDAELGDYELVWKFYDTITGLEFPEQSITLIIRVLKYVPPIPWHLIGVSVAAVAVVAVVILRKRRKP